MSAAVTSPVPRGEARRERLVEAALVVIADVGPDALTHRLVAAEAGLPLAATTYYFASKEQLVHAAFERAVTDDIERMAERAAVAATWAPASVATGLAQMMHEQITADRVTSLVLRSLWTEAVRRSELGPLAEQWADAYLDYFAGVLKRIDPKVTKTDVRLISAAIDGLLTEELTRERPDSKRRLTQLFKRLLGAFLDSTPR